LCVISATSTALLIAFPLAFSTTSPKFPEVKHIEIGTEAVTNEDGRKSNVSSIEICLAVKKTEK
jgi:hypothetical protein